MSKLMLLRDAVCAKLKYWDANVALEKALVKGDIPDNDADAIEQAISALAAGLDYPEQAYEYVTQEHLDELVGELA